MPWHTFHHALRTAPTSRPFDGRASPGRGTLLRMDLSGSTIALIATSTVAVASSVSPWLLRIGDRRHEREMLAHQRDEMWKGEWWMQRQSVYEESMRLTLHLASAVEAMAGGGADSIVDPKNPTYDVAPRIDTWGSQAAKKAYRDFMDSCLLFRMEAKNDVLRFTTARESLPEMYRTYGVLAELVNKELREGPANAAP